MALGRVQSTFTYTSSSGGVSWTFDILVDSFGNASVKNIRSPRGLVTDSLTAIPNLTVQDMNSALELAAVQSAEATIEDGTAEFTGTPTKTITLAETLNSTNYHVAYQTYDGTTGLYTTSKTVSSFVINVPFDEYGSAEVPLDVDWAVLIPVSNSVSLSGDATFTNADAGVVTVTFTTPLETDGYRVFLTPNGFFTATVLSQTRTYFQIQLGYSVASAETVTVGYNVFI